MDDRRPDEPAPNAGKRSDGTGGVPPAGGLPPDAEHRPIGALAIVGFLTFTIMVTWYGMYALNVVRN